LNDWTLAIKNKQSIVFAYIDYSKAFDCVTREKLLIKLSAYGITGSLLKWIDSFLSNRTQRTRVGSSLSDSVNLTSGVVLGSVIGPLLFLLFINEISEFLCCDHRTCKLYADDVKLYTTMVLNEDTALLQNKLDVLFEWSSTWQINISTSKCATMQINTLPGCPDLCINNIALSNEN
jgi:ribonucleases P/MRP protein subunit RPP40